MQRFRPLWVRDLSLYRVGAFDGLAASETQEGLGPQIRTRFRSTSDPECFALYSVRDGSGRGRNAPPPLFAQESHTLVVVREFRRVPLDASALAMFLFTAQPRETARVIASLAHWVEKAVSAYQPAYLLLAHSLEQPATSVVLAAVHERQALQWARPSPLSLHAVLPEVRPWLDTDPERYVYCPEPADHPETAPSSSRSLSPFAV